jgi:hypothetical protein
MMPILKHMEPCEEGTCEVEVLTEQVQELTKQINSAMDIKSVIEMLEKVQSEISGLENSGLRSYTRYGEDAMRSKCWDIIDDVIKSLQESLA